MFLLKIYLQKNDLSTTKVIFCDVIRCFIGEYDFTFIKSNISIETATGAAL